MMRFAFAAFRSAAAARIIGGGPSAPPLAVPTAVVPHSSSSLSFRPFVVSPAPTSALPTVDKAEVNLLRFVDVVSKGFRLTSRDVKDGTDDNMHLVSIRSVFDDMDNLGGDLCSMKSEADLAKVVCAGDFERMLTCAESVNRHLDGVPRFSDADFEANVYLAYHLHNVSENMAWNPRPVLKEGWRDWKRALIAIDRIEDVKDAMNDFYCSSSMGHSADQWSKDDAKAYLEGVFSPPILQKLTANEPKIILDLMSALRDLASSIPPRGDIKVYLHTLKMNGAEDPAMKAVSAVQSLRNGLGDDGLDELEKFICKPEE